jgi:hypothetical protein
MSGMTVMVHHQKRSLRQESLQNHVRENLRKLLKGTEPLLCPLMSKIPPWLQCKIPPWLQILYITLPLILRREPVRDNLRKLPNGTKPLLCPLMSKIPPWLQILYITLPLILRRKPVQFQP